MEKWGRGAVNRSDYISYIEMNLPSTAVKVYVRVILDRDVVCIEVRRLGEEQNGLWKGR